MRVSNKDVKQYSEIATLMSKADAADKDKITKCMKNTADFGYIILMRAAMQDTSKLDMKECAKCIKAMKNINAIAVKHKMRPIFKVTNDTIVEESINLIKSVVALNAMSRAKTQEKINKED